jgi:hypothetical protein
MFGKTRNFVAVASLFAALLTTTRAVAERIDTGYRTIQGTQVYVEVFHERGYARFSNGCGSQTLSQRQLQQGAIPSNIVPCSRPHGGGSPEKRKADHIRSAKERWVKAAQLFRDRKYVSAATEFDIAAGFYDAAGSPDSARLARVEARRSGCYGLATHEWDDANALRDLTKCREFPEMMKRIRDRIADLSRPWPPPAPTKTFNLTLVTTQSGRFFGVRDGIGISAYNAARELCRTYRANTATTREERRETCGYWVSVEKGCVALARSHDMLWGESGRYAIGLAYGKDGPSAHDGALSKCKSAGGQSCIVVPETVECTPDVWRWWDRS